MSMRTFLRRFRETTGTTPGAWLVAERVARAQELLEGEPLPIEAIAEACGFGSAAALRQHFRTRLGISPTTGISSDPGPPARPRAEWSACPRASTRGDPRYPTF
jgi:transcriptional regulator GlxA family with amidase domain